VGDDEVVVARQLAEVDALRRRVLNVVGHELRTPVTTLRGLAEAVPTAGEDELRDVIAPALVRSALRIERLVDDLLLASGITTVLPTGPAQSADVDAATRAAWAEVGDDGDVTVEVGGATAAVPGGDPTLVRILRPVLENAARYGVGAVVVRADGAAAEIAITVESGGDLVNEADLGLAFEPFYRGEAAVMTAPGLGVGLPIARSLTEQAGGRIEMTARSEGGVIVRLELPRP